MVLDGLSVAPPLVLRGAMLRRYAPSWCAAGTRLATLRVSHRPWWRRRRCTATTAFHSGSEMAHVPACVGMPLGSWPMTWWPQGGTRRTHLLGWYRMSHTVHCSPLLNRPKLLLQITHVPELTCLVSCGLTSTAPRTPSISVSCTTAFSDVNSSVSSVRSDSSLPWVAEHAGAVRRTVSSRQRRSGAVAVWGRRQRRRLPPPSRGRSTVPRALWRPPTSLAQRRPASTCCASSPLRRSRAAWP